MRFEARVGGNKKTGRLEHKLNNFLFGLAKHGDVSPQPQVRLQRDTSRLQTEANVGKDESVLTRRGGLSECVRERGEPAPVSFTHKLRWGKKKPPRRLHEGNDETRPGVAGAAVARGQPRALPATAVEPPSPRFRRPAGERRVEGGRAFRRGPRRPPQVDAPPSNSPPNSVLRMM
jgi:hypothetical protein